MQVVVQRVTSARVRVEGEIVGEIGSGLLALVGIAAGDEDDALRWMARKVAGLRIFPDEAGRFDRSLLDVGGSLLSVSQFTLLGEVRTGMRPSFTRAADPEVALPAWERFNDYVREQGVPVETGRFGAMMQVELVNDGPVTIQLSR